MKSINSNWCTVLIILTQLTAFIPFGINLTALNPSTPAIKVFINDTYKVRCMVSVPMQPWLCAKFYLDHFCVC